MDRLKAEAKLEESLQTLDSLVADAALIHLELDITRKNIEKAFEYLTSQQSLSPEFDPRLTEEQLHAAARKINNRHLEMSAQLERDKKSYSGNWKARKPGIDARLSSIHKLSESYLSLLRAGPTGHGVLMSSRGRST